MKFSELVAQRQKEIDKKALEAEAAQERLGFRQMLAKEWLRAAAINALTKATGLDVSELSQPGVLSLRYSIEGNRVFTEDMWDGENVRRALTFSDMGMVLDDALDVPYEIEVTIELPEHLPVSVDMVFRIQHFKATRERKFAVGVEYSVDGNHRDVKPTLADALIRARELYHLEEVYQTQEEAGQDTDDAELAATRVDPVRVASGNWRPPAAILNREQPEEVLETPASFVGTNPVLTTSERLVLSAVLDRDDLEEELHTACFNRSALRAANVDLAAHLKTTKERLAEQTALVRSLGNDLHEERERSGNLRDTLEGQESSFL